MAIEFIFDREEQRLMDDLSKIAHSLENPDEKRKAFVLGQFTRMLIEASSKKQVASVQKKFYRVPIQLRRPQMVTRQLPGTKRLEVTPIPYPGMPEAPEFKLTAVPEAPDVIETSFISPSGVERKPLIFDRETNKPLAEVEVTAESYNLIEPPLNENEILVLSALDKKISGNPMKVLGQPKKLTKLTGKFCRKYSVAFTPDSYRKLRYYLIKELINLSKIDPIFNDPRITAIYCDGTEQPLTVEYDGRKLKTNVHLKTSEEINHVISQLGKRANKAVNAKESLLEVVIGDKKVVANYGSDWVPANFKISKVTTGK